MATAISDSLTANNGASPRANFLRRHPSATLLVFTLSPILTQLAFTVGAVALLILSAQLVAWLGGDNSTVNAFGRSAAPFVLTAAAIVIPSMLSTYLFFQVSKWSGISRRWTVISCLVVSLLAAASCCRLQFSEIPGKNSLTFGLGLGVQTLDLHQLLQASVPLILGVWLWHRSRWER